MAFICIFLIVKLEVVLILNFLNFRVPGIELGPNVRPVTESSSENATTNSITTTSHINPEHENLRCINNVTALVDSVTNDTNVSNESETTSETLTNARNLLTANTTNVNSTLNDINVTTSLTNVRNALNNIVTSDIDISNWDALPSTSRETDSISTRDKIESKSVAKICGQNVCLDDSILKRTSRNSDDEFFAELDRISDSNDDDFTYTQRLRINDDEHSKNSDRYVYWKYLYESKYLH